MQKNKIKIPDKEMYYDGFRLGDTATIKALYDNERDRESHISQRTNWITTLFLVSSGIIGLDISKIIVAGEEKTIWFFGVAFILSGLFLAASFFQREGKIYNCKGISTFKKLSMLLKREISLKKFFTFIQDPTVLYYPPSPEEYMRNRYMKLYRKNNTRERFLSLATISVFALLGLFIYFSYEVNISSIELPLPTDTPQLPIPAE